MDDALAVASREMRWVTQETYWRALRQGRLGTFIGVYEQQPVSAEGWLTQLQLQCPADTADAERAFIQAWRLLRAGTSADHQLSVLGTH